MHPSDNNPPDVFQRLVDSLTRAGIEFTSTHHEAVYTSAEAAAVRGTTLHNGAKALILKTYAYDYDGLHRLTSAGYDVYGGQTKNEDFSYDHLGNRVTYYDHRNAVTTAYTNNVVNEYATMQALPGGSAIDVYYDPAGNVSRDENVYDYFYDYDNRLTAISHWEDWYYTPVASFEYDALGRMITSWHRFDGELSHQTETFKHYYDGQQVIAEYDPSDNLSHRFVHGTAGVDERALMAYGEGWGIGARSPSVMTLPSRGPDTYYYLLRELNTVAGIAAKNGTLVEAYHYDAYGKVTLWGFSPADFNRDGDVDSDDLDYLYSLTPADPATDKMADLNYSETIDEIDEWMAEELYYTGSGATPVELYVSGVGNPYFFTGRRLHFLETRHEGTPTNLYPNWQVQYNRARHYTPHHGRWIQRDPIGYADGMNLYEYVRSNPAGGVDPSGLRTVPFKFYVFIPGRLSTTGWMREPLSSTSEFRTDQRGFGQHPTSRMWTLGYFESTRIGKLLQGGWHAFTQVGASHRRQIANTSVVESATARLRNNVRRVSDRKCASRIQVSGEAGYPFIFSGAVPPIRYTLYLGLTVPRKDKVKIDWTLVYTSFPDNEFKLDGRWVHQFPTRFTTPFALTLQQASSGSLTVNAKTPKCCP